MKFPQLAVLISSILTLSSSQDGVTFCAYTPSLKRSDCRPVAGTNFQFSVIPNDLPTEVETIIMSGNDISMLHPGNLTFYRNLTTLHLNDTLISSLPAGLASIESSIKNLYLDGNPLIQIDDSTFQHFTNIKTLSLRRTNLKTLRPTMFIGLTTIEELYLDESSLAELPDHLFTEIPNVKVVSITNTNLQTIPSAIFNDLDLLSSDLQIYLANNPWSCDCNLQWFQVILQIYVAFPEDRNILRCQWPTDDLMAELQFIDFLCSAPNVTASPQNASILTDETYILTCSVTGSPFPQVTWLKDGVSLNYTTHVYLQLFDASLHFSNIELNDAGVYQCIVENSFVMDSSAVANLIIQEATCFDGLLSSHETDVDCGGEFCKQCLQTQRCRMDSDCSGSLVCLYVHALSSLLHYISPNHQMAYTCELPEVPSDLLNNRIQDVMSSNIFSFDFTVDSNVDTLKSSMAAIIAEQLQIPVSSLNNVRVTTVERTSAQSTPLVQIWFDLVKTLDGQRGRENLSKQVDNGQMKGTVKIIEYNSYISVRINL